MADDVWFHIHCIYGLLSIIFCLVVANLLILSLVFIGMGGWRGA